jgi:uncharacterized membrane protein
VFGSIYPFIVNIILLFGAVAVLSQDVLKSLIEAEATIIGFFGLILIYALTSFDNRQDRLEQHFYDLAIASKADFKVNFGGATKTISEIAETYGPLLKNLRENRKRLVDISVFVGFFLVLSLFSAILALGIPNQEWAFYLSTFSLASLFLSIFQIFWMIYDLGKKPESPPPS